MVRILAAARCFVLGFVVFQVVCASSAQAAGDPEKGAKAFRRCAICHSVQADGPNKVGPNLFGIVGRRAAAIQSYMYSMALEMAAFAWTEDRLISFLQRPKQVLPGTKMSFNGLTSVDEAWDIVAYLKSLK